MDALRVISTRTHGFLDLGVAALLIVAPWLFGFSDVDAAMWISIVAGVAILASELMTDFELGLMPVIPMSAHLALDALLGIFLAVSPWLFGFADEDGWWWHLVAGLAILGTAAMTRTEPAGTRRTARA